MGPRRPPERNRIRLVWPGDWDIWSQSGRVVGYLLAVEAPAVAVAVLAAVYLPIPSSDWWRFGVLALCSAAYIELSASIERIRHQPSGRPHVDLNSVWLFAAVLLLHPTLVAVLVAFAYGHWWLRVKRHVVFRSVFSAASMALASFAAIGVLMLFDRQGRLPEMVGEVEGFLVILLACLVYFVLQTTFVAGAIMLTTRRSPLNAIFAKYSDSVLELVAAMLGVIVAWALVDWPLMIAVVAATTLLLHRTLLIRQLTEAARTDPKTGLLNINGWHDLAGRELVRAARRGTRVAVLIIDLDGFKGVNDRYGHVAGDEVLAAVARTISDEVRGFDLVARFGGEEFLVLLVGAEPREAVEVAERIRRAIADLVLPVTAREGTVLFRDTTASVGIALHPHHGSDLDQLVRAADSALYAAKAAGRNQLQIAARLRPATVSERPTANLNGHVAGMQAHRAAERPATADGGVAAS